MISHIKNDWSVTLNYEWLLVESLSLVLGNIRVKPAFDCKNRTCLNLKKGVIAVFVLFRFLFTLGSTRSQV